MQTMKRRDFMFIGPVTGALLAISCGSPSDAVTGLQLILTAINIAEPILAATGVIPAPLIPVLSLYLSQATNFVVSSATELQGTDTPTEKIAFILALAVKLSLPDLSGLQASQAQPFQAIQVDVQNYVTPMSRALLSPHLLSPVSVRLGVEDRKQLAVVKAKAAVIALNERGVVGI